MSNKVFMWKIIQELDSYNPDVLYSLKTDWNDRFGPLAHIEIVELHVTSCGHAWGQDYVGKAFDVGAWPEVSKSILAQAKASANEMGGNIACLGKLRLVTTEEVQAYQIGRCDDYY